MVLCFSERSNGTAECLTHQSSTKTYAPEFAGVIRNALECA